MANTILRCKGVKINGKSITIHGISYVRPSRLPFPDSVGGIFHGPATTQKVYPGIEWFSQLAGLQ